MIYKKYSKKLKKYLFYKKGKRLSKAKYYTYLKRKSKSIPKPEKYSGKYVTGLNFERNISILISNYTIEEIFKKIEIFYKIIKRSKRLNKNMYISLKGIIYWDDGTKEKRQFYTQRSFVQEYQDLDFRKTQCLTMIESIFNLLEENFERTPSLYVRTPDRFKTAEDVKIKTIIIAQRN